MKYIFATNQIINFSKIEIANKIGLQNEKISRILKQVHL